MRYRHALITLSLMAALGASIAGQDQNSHAATAPQADGQDQQPVVAKGEIVSKLDLASLGVFHAKNGDTWFTSKDRGAYRYDGKNIVNFTTKDGLNYNSIGGFQEDKAGNIYVTTSPDYDPVRRRFTQDVFRFDGKTFTLLPVPEKAAPADAWKLQPDDLWFGGGQDSDAVIRYDGKTMHRLQLPRTKEGDEHLAKWPRSQFPNIKSSPYDTYVIFKDSKGNVWFGTASLGVCRYDGRSFAWIPESELRNGSFGTRSIIEDKDGKFWFCDSLHRYVVDLSDPAGPRFKKEEGIRDPKDPAKPLIEGIMSALVDNTGVLWMATYGDGVWRYDGKEATRYPVKDGEQEITLHTMRMDKQGVLWLGTHSAGPYKFNGKTFEKFKL